MRIQLELSEASVEQVKHLMTKANIKTYSELFGNALAILNWAVREKENGRVILSADQNNQQIKELAMHILDSVGG
ncbi:MAG: hypothetical protein WAN65_32940 [Candidatus Sulfotelmatobacter sp.]